MRTVNRISKPLFLVGSGRSGTTLLYELLCCHPDLAWFSNYTTKWPRLPVLAAAHKMYPWLRDRHLRPRFAPFPTEGYGLWDHVRSGHPGAPGVPLTEEDASDGEAEFAHRLIAQHLRFQNAVRFINKNTRNVIRMRYLRALFVDAQFVHIIRDPRAVVASTLRVAWWPDLPIWFQAGETPREWVQRGNNETRLAAALWRNEVGVALADKEQLEPGQYFQLRYEELVDDPLRALRQVAQFAELRWHPRLERQARISVIPGSKAKYVGQLSAADIAVIEDEVRALALELGYSLRSA